MSLSDSGVATPAPATPLPAPEPTPAARVVAAGAGDVAHATSIIVTPSTVVVVATPRRVRIVVRLRPRRARSVGERARFVDVAWIGPQRHRRLPHAGGAGAARHDDLFDGLSRR